MPDASARDPEEEPQAAPATNVSGGVNLDAQRDVTVGGDVVGRDKTTTSIDTGGGAHVAGDVNATEFVGRDKITTIGYTVEQVSTLLTQIGSTFQPKPFDGRCPYLGLDAFSEDDADRFFGRETLVSELIERVKDSRFVVIAGPSGSGKSSLVRAGLIHVLKQGALPNSDRWLYATLTPGRDPIESLALAMSRMAKSPDAGDYIRKNKTEADALHKFSESILSDRKDQRAVIFVDQFEEVFTQVSKEDERVAFLSLLTHAATIESGRVTVLFALRSDFVSNCAMYPQLNALLNQQFMQVGAMQSDELVSAIARPALQAGLRIDLDLVAQIVNDMQDEPGVLPLMQFALKDLFDVEQAKGGVIALTLNDYLARGGLRKALERHADAVFAKLSESEQHLARMIFSGLIEIGRGTQDTRRTAVLDELIPANVVHANVEAVIHKLADAPARLLTTDEQAHRVTVTLAHERLIDAWPWLRRLVNESREAIALQNQIVEDAQEWEKHQQDVSYLYSGARLATAQAKLDTSNIRLSMSVRTFLNASHDKAQTEKEAELKRSQEKEQQRQRELDDARRIARVERKARQRSYLIAGGLALISVIAILLLLWPRVLALTTRGEMVLVPGGIIMMGTNSNPGPKEGLASWSASVADFHLEKYEVTNEKYERCVSVNACSLPANRASFEGQDKVQLPVVFVTMSQADDYCRWIGRRLPTELEWEWAAKGAEKRDYPTGNLKPDPVAVNAGTYIRGVPAGTEPRRPVTELMPDQADTFGLVGNVQEWTLSFYYTYSEPEYRGAHWTPQSEIPAKANGMVVARGGSFVERIERARTTARHPIIPTFPVSHVGFRCVEGGSLENLLKEDFSMH